MAAAAPFAKIANNRCKSSLTYPTCHSESAENEDFLAITFANFANWVMAIMPSQKLHLYFELSQKPIAKS